MNFHHKEPVIQKFDAFFVFSPNKLLSKQLICCWFEKLHCSCYVTVMKYVKDCIVFCFYEYRLSLLVTSLGADILQGCFITMSSHSLLKMVKCCFLFIQTWPISCHCIAIFGVRWCDIRPWYKRTWLCFWNANCTTDTLRCSNTNRQSHNSLRINHKNILGILCGQLNESQIPSTFMILNTQYGKYILHPIPKKVTNCGDADIRYHWLFRSR